MPTRIEHHEKCVKSNQMSSSRRLVLETQKLKRGREKKTRICLIEWGPRRPFMIVGNPKDLYDYQISIMF